MDLEIRYLLAMAAELLAMAAELLAMRLSAAELADLPVLMLVYLLVVVL